MSNCQFIKHSIRAINSICLAENCTAESRYGCPECIESFHSQHSADCYSFEEIHDSMEKINIKQILDPGSLKVKEKQIQYFFEMIQEQFRKKLNIQREAVLRRIGTLKSYYEIWEVSVQGNLTLLNANQLIKLSQLINAYKEQQQQQSVERRKSIMSMFKSKSAKTLQEQIQQDNTVAWNEIQKIQQSILEQYKSVISFDENNWQEIPQDRFKSPIQQVQNLFQEKRIIYQEAPDDYLIIRGQTFSQKCYRLENGDLYQGETLYGRLHGRGILIRKDGTIFEGVFEWGDFKWGAKFWWDVKNFKTSYEMGKMFEWQLNGKGVQSTGERDFEQYVGDFYQGKLSGFGVYSNSNGFVQNSYGNIFYSYEGEWKNSERDGRGTMSQSNGEKYVGDWRNNMKHGEGTLYYHNGDIYTGQFVNNKREGSGYMEYANGQKYSGDWLNDKKHGKGVQNYKNGQRFLKYEGDFKNDKKDGKGVFYYSNGERYDGEWKNGNFDGFGIYYYKNGDRYEGLSKQGKREGSGIYYFSDGKKYVGTYRNDQREGLGTYYSTNGTKYIYSIVLYEREEGEYQKSIPIGEHKCYDATNRLIKIRIYDKNGTVVEEKYAEQ